MKTLWIGMMAVTFVLGTGMVAVMYIFGKMASSIQEVRGEASPICR